METLRAARSNQLARASVGDTGSHGMLYVPLPVVIVSASGVGAIIRIVGIRLPSIIPCAPLLN